MKNNLERMHDGRTIAILETEMRNTDTNVSTSLGAVRVKRQTIHLLNQDSGYLHAKASIQNTVFPFFF